MTQHSRNKLGIIVLWSVDRGRQCHRKWSTLHLTAMSSTHDPTENASTYTSSSATDHDGDIDELEDDDDTSSEVSYGDDLRVRNFILPSTAAYLKINGTFRVTSR